MATTIITNNKKTTVIIALSRYSVLCHIFIHLKRGKYTHSRMMFVYLGDTYEMELTINKSNNKNTSADRILNRSEKKNTHICEQNKETKRLQCVNRFNLIGSFDLCVCWYCCLLFYFIFFHFFVFLFTYKFPMWGQQTVYFIASAWARLQLIDSIFIKHI